MKKSPLYVGLVHYPIYDKNFNVITTAITNYDLHDISRSAKTYGIKKYFIIHDVPGQLDMVHKIMGFWESDTGRNYNGYRTQAFDIVDIRPSIGCRSRNRGRRQEALRRYDRCPDLFQHHFL